MMILDQKENLATDFGVVADPEEAREVDGFEFERAPVPLPMTENNWVG